MRAMKPPFPIDIEFNPYQGTADVTFWIPTDLNEEETKRAKEALEAYVKGIIKNETEAAKKLKDAL